MSAKNAKKIQLGVEPVYDVRQLPLSKTLLLGLQHMFAMFGATVLVPILTGINISTALLMAGLGTLIFHLITGGKVPAFLGSSFAFIAGYHAVAGVVGESFDPTLLPKAHGGVVISGLLYIVLAALIRAFGVKRVMRFFPPVVTGPIIISIGLILAPVAINNCRTDWLLAMVASVTVIVFNIWGKGMFKIIPIMLGIIVAYVLAIVLKRVDFAELSTLRAVDVPLVPSQFAQFDLSAILTILPISLATMMEHIGDISAISATTGTNYIAKPGLHRTLLGDGIATSFSAFFGGPANTTYGENTGVLALTRVYDPRVMRIAAGFAILLAFFPHVAGIIRLIPAAVIGGVSLILYGMISAIGVRNMVENQVDLTSSRNLIVAASILVTALGFNSTGGLTFVIGRTSINLSGLAIAAIVGILINAILPGKDYDFKEEEPKKTGTGVDFSGVTDRTVSRAFEEVIKPAREKAREERHEKEQVGDDTVD